MRLERPVGMLPRLCSQGAVELHAAYHDGPGSMATMYTGQMLQASLDSLRKSFSAGTIRHDKDDGIF